MIPYSGLEDFIKLAEINVQKVSVSLHSIPLLSSASVQAIGKREQEMLADRFEMKVPATKRAQW